MAAISAKQAAATAPTPAARPSMLSSRLKALVMPTTHSRVTATSTRSGPGNATWMPAAISAAAAASWASNLTTGGSPNRSSHRPHIEIQLAPSMIAASCTSSVRSGNSSNEPMTAPQMAIPPSSGTGEECSLRAAG